MNWFIFAFISAIFSAVAAISEKKALFKLSALDFSFLVSVVTLVLSIPFFFSVTYQDNLTVNLTILFAKTILNAGAFLCVMLAIKNLEISEALPLLALSPGLVAVFGSIIIQDTLFINEWVGISLMVAGTYVLELRKENSGIFDPFKSLFSLSKYKYVLIALLLFTVTALVDRLLLKDYKLPPYTFMAFQQLFFAVIFLTVVLYKQKSFTAPFKTIDKKVFQLILLVSIFTVIYRYTQIEAVKLAPAALVLSVKRLSVLFAIIIGGKLFKENNIWRRAVAVVIILLGIILLVN